tara:strand:+ start:2523 stop:2978 length:456 start_codon:yes stop_codon:yes gene_type:complete
MKFVLLVFFLFIVNCSNNKVVKKHGSSSLELKIDKVEVNQTNKNDVIQLFGKPSSISLFDENSWFYIEREKVNQSIFKLGKSKIRKNQVLEIHYDNTGIVKYKRLYNLENMNDLKIVKEITKKKYDTSSSFNKLIKSLEQKINSPTTTKKK